jgi:hypothetical protein
MFSLSNKFSSSSRYSDTCSKLKGKILRLTTEIVTFSWYVTNNLALFFICGNSELIVVKIFNPPRMFYLGGILGWIKIRCKTATHEIYILCKLWVNSGVGISLSLVLVGWKLKSVTWRKVLRGWIFSLRRSLWLTGIKTCVADLRAI